MKSHLKTFLALFIFKVLSLTCRYRITFENNDDREVFFGLKNQLLNRPYLIAFFHQDELCLIPYFQNTGLSVLVSLSSDGSLMSRLANKLGYRTVRGSSSKGAVRGLISAIRSVKDGHSFCFAIDGPRGPIFKVKPGITAVSKKTNTQIIPLRAYPSSRFIFQKSWNKAKLPLPFSKIEIRVGKIQMYETTELEKYLTLL